MTTVLLDPKVREDFEKLLPKDKTLADALREYMQEVVTENKQKKGEASLQSLPILTSKVRQTSLTEYTILHINSLAETSDETLEAALKEISFKKSDLVFEKLGTMRSILFDLDHVVK